MLSRTLSRSQSRSRLSRTIINRFNSSCSINNNQFSKNSIYNTNRLILPASVLYQNKSQSYRFATTNKNNNPTDTTTIPANIDSTLPESVLDSLNTQITDLQCLQHELLLKSELNKKLKSESNTTIREIYSNVVNHLTVTSISIQSLDNELLAESIQKTILYTANNGNDSTDRIYFNSVWDTERTKIKSFGIFNYNATIQLHRQNNSNTDSNNNESIVEILLDCNDCANRLNSELLLELQSIMNCSELNQSEFIWFLSFIFSHPSDYSFDIISAGLEGKLIEK